MPSPRPSVELHLHFGGTIAPELALRLAERHAIDPAAIGLGELVATGRYPARYRDLGQFLDLYGRVDSLVRTAEDVFDVAAAAAAVQAVQGVAWTEVIVPIWPYLGRGIPARGLWDALAAGLGRGAEGSRFGILLEIGHEDPPPSDRVADAVVEGAQRGLPVVGVGLMGVGPPAARARLARESGEWRAAGLGLQVHAGEVGPPQNVVAAIDELGANRIAHGITIVRDAAILERTIRDRTPLDLCPTSNVAIAGAASLEAHPIGDLWRAGAVVTVSTDDPPFVGTTLGEELARVGALLGLDERGLVELQRRTLDVSFAPPEIRASVLARLDAADAALAGDGPISRPVAGT